MQNLVIFQDFKVFKIIRKVQLNSCFAIPPKSLNSTFFGKLFVLLKSFLCLMVFASHSTRWFFTLRRNFCIILLFNLSYVAPWLLRPFSSKLDWKMVLEVVFMGILFIYIFFGLWWNFFREFFLLMQWVRFRVLEEV